MRQVRKDGAVRSTFLAVEREKREGRRDHRRLLEVNRKKKKEGEFDPKALVPGTLPRRKKEVRGEAAGSGPARSEGGG